MKEIYVISCASEVDGKLESHGVFLCDSYEDAILTVQDSIADDFGYCDRESYLSKRNPEIIEGNGVYSIYDENCGHEEIYRVEKITV